MLINFIVSLVTNKFDYMCNNVVPVVSVVVNLYNLVDEFFHDNSDNNDNTDVG